MMSAVSRAEARLIRVPEDLLGLSSSPTGRWRSGASRRV